MNNDFSFRLLHTDHAARLGEILTPRGTIQTPSFMPVGTLGSVKGMYMDQIRDLGADIILGNTYHLMLRPGAERVHRLGGLHSFIGWNRPILTDSGGFQVMSLAKLRKITPHSVVFRSHLNGALYELSPERAMEIQMLLGADICMQLDECISLPAKTSEIQRAMELSLQWAQRCSIFFGKQPGKAMFGIVQGGDDLSIRLQSARELCLMNFPGYAIGGLAVGESQETMLGVLDVVCGALPKEKPRYLMGVGTPQDIVKAVLKGVDMFDCSMPTRAGRHGLAFTSYGRCNLRNARYAEDTSPLDETRSCPAARNYSKAYLHHLIKSGEILGGMLLSWNNLSFYQDLMRDIRQAIQHKTISSFAEKLLYQYEGSKYSDS